MRDRLQSHVVVSMLRDAQEEEAIGQADIIAALRVRFPAYSFEDTTWATYANYFISWLKHFDIDLGRRLLDATPRGGSAETFTPQSRPERDIKVFASFRHRAEQRKSKQLAKSLYDLKALGLVSYDANRVYLSRRDSGILKTANWRLEIATLATQMPKIRSARDAYEQCKNNPDMRFEDALGSVLNSISSESYRKIICNILKAWARFADGELELKQRQGDQVHPVSEFVASAKKRTGHQRPPNRGSQAGREH